MTHAQQDWRLELNQAWQEAGKRCDVSLQEQRKRLIPETM